MASSSVSQEDVENDFELSSRRSRIRTARARTVNPASRIEESLGELKVSESINASGSYGGEHDASPKPMSRTKEKRVNRGAPVRQPLADHLNRPNHMSKGKQQHRRKLREKRRSTGVVHLPSTESTGGSTGEDDGESLSMNTETARNTLQNEQMPPPESVTEDRVHSKIYPRRTKRGCCIERSPSDLEADDEDTQDLDSLNQSDSTANSVPQCRRPGTPTADNPDELLERAQEENRRLLSLLEDKDHKINVLETRIKQLQLDMTAERDRLRSENATLIRAMTSLTSK